MKGTPEEDEYLAALGGVISAYADAETAVHILARNLSGLDDDKARIVFGGMQLRHVMDRVRKLLALDSSPADMVANVESCFTQLGIVGTARDRLAHRSIFIGREGVVASNYMTARDVLAPERDTFTLREMWAMRIDCIAILARLIDVAVGNPPRSATAAEMAVREPWRYKPARQRSGSRGHQGSVTSQNRPPSSRE
jgi:hypothetical protein